MQQENVQPIHEGKEKEENSVKVRFQRKTKQMENYQNMENMEISFLIKQEWLQNKMIANVYTEVL